MVWAEEALTKIQDDFGILVRSLDEGKLDPTWSSELTERCVPRFARHIEKIRAEVARGD